VIKRGCWFQREWSWKQRATPQRDRRIFVLVSMGHGTRLWRLYHVHKWRMKRALF